MSLFDASKLSSFEIPADLITIANKGVDNLRDRLVDEIDTSCLLPGYVIRWSIQMFFQGHVRRSLMFIEGGHDAFLSGRGLVAYACARAIYETFACVFDFCDKVTEHIQSRNFEKAAAFIHGRKFSARMKDFISKDILETETIDNTAVNILTQIDRLSKSFTELKEEYDFLSERTHPNGLGSLIGQPRDRRRLGFATTSRARSTSIRIAISARPGSSRVKFGVGLVTTAYSRPADAPRFK
jgi:hypothetical protein